jgi:hypothetical protein
LGYNNRAKESEMPTGNEYRAQQAADLARRVAEARARDAAAAAAAREAQQRKS